MSLTTTDTRSKRYSIQAADGAVITYGELPAGNHLASSHTVIADEDPATFLAAVPAAQFPALPDSGWLEAGVIYRYADEAVIVRQSHHRTEHAPSEALALFLTYRMANGIEWMANERVTVGDLRAYEGTAYRCLQSHVTQAAMTPPQTLLVLWVEHSEDEIRDWPEHMTPQLAFSEGELMRYTDGHIYRSLIDNNVWSPVAYPAGWELVE